MFRREGGSRCSMLGFREERVEAIHVSLLFLTVESVLCMVNEMEWLHRLFSRVSYLFEALSRRFFSHLIQYSDFLLHFPSLFPLN